MVLDHNKNAEHSRERLKEILFSVTKEEIIRFQEEFVEASVEFQSEPYIDFMEESEDGIADIANWIVSNGKDFCFKLMETPEEIPHSVADLTDQILYGVADEVCLENLRSQQVSIEMKSF
ncbi:ferredoxin [Sphingobacterium prati]